MCINQFAKAITIINPEDTTPISIYMHHDTERNISLWEGEAKDLINQGYLADFLIVEILVDRSPKFDHLPDHSKGKIITVV